MKTNQGKQEELRSVSTEAKTQATINRRRRRRVLRAAAGAVIGGLIAGPVGAAAGAVVGASRKRGLAQRKAVASGSRIKTGSAKSSKPGKARAAKRRPNPTRKKPFTNIYPPIP